METLTAKRGSKVGIVAGPVWTDIGRDKAEGQVGVQDELGPGTPDFLYYTTGTAYRRLTETLRSLRSVGRGAYC